MPEANSTTEIWKPIAGYETLYEVSDLGRVRRVADWIMHRGGLRRRAPYLLTPHPNAQGYLRATLRKDGRVHTFLVATLVMRTHGIPRPAGTEIDHENGEKTDNRFANLEYVTHAENMRRARARASAAGLAWPPCGERNPNSKLTTTEVQEIRTLGGTLSQRRIAMRFLVDKSTVQDILHRETWKHV